jgi:hypothetical protein
MTSTLFKYLRPWSLKRERLAQQLAALRARDGDDCARCRRPIRFDRPAGHDMAPRIESLGSEHRATSIESLCLTHGRCNAQGQDHTDVVNDRLRLAREAQLLSKRRSKRRAA